MKSSAYWHAGNQKSLSRQLFSLASIKSDLNQRFIKNNLSNLRFEINPEFRDLFQDDDAADGRSGLAVQSLAPQPDKCCGSR